MKNIRLNTLTPAAKNLLSKFAAMAADESGKVEARFVCTEVLSKRENGTLTSLKNKDLLSSELCEGENGAELHICLSDAALDLIGQMETPVQKLTRKAKKYVAKDVAKAEEAPAAAEVVEEPAPAPVEPAAEEVKEEKPAKKARKTNKKAAKTEEAPKAEEEIPATEESPAAIEPEDEEDEAPASAFAEKDIDPIWAKRMNGIMAMFQPIEAGTILTRVYKGQCYQVQMCADGSCIDYANGKSYNSLSHAARCITGRKSVPGRKFFKVDGKRVLHNDK